MKIFNVLLFVLSCLWFSQPSQASDLAETGHLDVTKANQILQDFSAHFSTKNSNVADYKDAVHTLTQIQLQAKKCVDDTTDAVEDVKKQIQEAKIELTKTKLTPDQQFLLNKQNQLTTQLSDCRLFVLRSQEALDKYNAALQELIKTHLFSRETSIFVSLAALPFFIREIVPQFNQNELLKQSGAYIFNFPNLTLFILTLLLGLGFGYLIRLFLKPRLKKEYSPESLCRTIMAIKYGIYDKIIFFTMSLAASIFVTITNFTNYYSPFLVFLVDGLFAYSILSIIIEIFLAPRHPSKAIIQLPNQRNQKIARRLKYLAILLIVFFATPYIFEHQPIPFVIERLAKTIYITLLCATLISIIRPIGSLPKALYRLQPVRFSISFMALLILVLAIIAEWLGYHNLATYLIKGIIITILATLSIWLVLKTVNWLISNLNQNKYVWQVKFHNWLNLKPNEKLNELLWLRVVFYILIAITFLLLLLKAWGLKESNFSLLVNALLNGFNITGIEIMPARIIFGIILFALLVLMTRLVKSHIIRRFSKKMERGAGEAVASIAGYIGFAIALIFGLLLAGVNFAGLAIIAGALSVGIGFGLQNIVNNFLSGLILLVERPIKAGDRIIVGDTEGIVKRISIRSTQVKIGNRADVIVPNSELITKQVTNLTFQDLHYQISIPLRLAYGTDLNKVKQVLLDIAHRHPEVTHDDDSTQVMFKSFGENALNFELTCGVKNIGQRGTVINELLYEIERSFRENDIKFAYPRQDVRIIDTTRNEDT